MDVARELPQDLEAEKSILGAMLISAEAAEIAFEQMKSDDFYSAAHREIFSAMLSLRDAGSAIDIITLVSELTRRHTIETVGGIMQITDLSANVPSTANTGHYVNIVLEKSKLRKLIKVSSDISNDSYQAEKRVDEILNKAEKDIFNIALNNEKSTLESVSGILKITMESIVEMSERKGALSGVPTGFPELDHMLAGLQKSNLIILAARPSMGKTSLAMNIAQHAALRADKTVAVFSLEMSKPELTNRVLCSEAMVDMEKVRHGRLDEEDWRKLITAMGHLSESSLYIDDTAGISVAEIRSKCRRLMVEKKTLDLIVIDYLTLMDTSTDKDGSKGRKSDSYQQDIAKLSGSLKGLARELKVPVIVISQLSRAAAKRTGDHRPVLSDLRDSGAIEQDADVVLFVHRESYYRDKGEEDDGLGEIIVAKQRNGPTGKVDVRWLKQYTRFMPASDREEP